MRLRPCVLLLGLMLCACSTQPVRDDDLHLALDGRESIARGVDSTLLRVLSDARINGPFRATDPAAFAPLLVDQICEASGGPCR